MLVAGTEFFGEEEALPERTRDLLGPVSVQSPTAAWSEPVARAIATGASRRPGAPIDRIELRFKGDQPTVAVFTGRLDGGEDRRYVVDARTGALLADEGCADEGCADAALLYRRTAVRRPVTAGWGSPWGGGLARVALTASGLAIWWRIRRPDATGLRRFFW